MHHKQKIDAPSGTAYMLGKAAAEGRGINLEQHSVRCATAIPVRAIPATSVSRHCAAAPRPAMHTVIFAGPYERIELAHKSESRMIFAHGALKAALWAKDKKPGHYSMTDVLGLSD